MNKTLRDQGKDTMKYWDVRTYQDFRDFAGLNLVTDSRDPRVSPKLKRKGMATITLRNWRLLEPLLYTMVEMSHAIFRGVAQNEDNNYELQPSIFRNYGFKHGTYGSKHTASIKDKNKYVERCYQHFLQVISRRKGALSRSIDNYRKYEIWSLGRHFGVHNTMLDWSHSPYISLFFAFADREKDAVRSLYCLKKNIIEEARTGSTATPRIGGSMRVNDNDICLTRAPNYDSLLFYEPLGEDNFRMINQQGVFTVSRSPHSIEDWVVRNYPRVLRHLNQQLHRASDEKMRKRLNLEIRSRWILLKVDIDTNREDRGQILRWLNRMNINHASLFPDEEGASLYTNMQGDIRHY